MPSCCASSGPARHDDGRDAARRLRTAQTRGRRRDSCKVLDLGVGFDADSLWFNLKPGGFASDAARRWLQHDALRRAISMAVDRQLFANTVFLGAGVPVYGPITPAEPEVVSPKLPPMPHDPAGAESAAGDDRPDRQQRRRPARGRQRHSRRVFTSLAQKGNTSIERGAAVIRDELKKIGVTVDVVALDGNAVIQQLHVRAVRRGVLPAYHPPTPIRPVNPDFWLSSGSAHAWNLEQKTPATEWEARIDELMRRQMASSDEAERKRLFDEVQTIFAEHLPMIQFVAPRIYVAASPRVINVAPAVQRPQLLWSPDTIAVAMIGTGMLAYLVRRLVFALVPGVHRVVGVAAAGAIAARRFTSRSRWASAPAANASNKRGALRA